MTNEEIIRNIRYLAKKHRDDIVLTFETNFHVAFTDIANHIEEQAEENTNLKAEIEQLLELLKSSCDFCHYKLHHGNEEPCRSCKTYGNWKLKGRVEE